MASNVGPFQQPSSIASVQRREDAIILKTLIMAPTRGVESTYGVVWVPTTPFLIGQAHENLHFNLKCLGTYPWHLSFSVQC